jgi:hypothetical protein
MKEKNWSFISLSYVYSDINYSNSLILIKLLAGSRYIWDNREFQQLEWVIISAIEVIPVLLQIS